MSIHSPLFTYKILTLGHFSGQSEYIFYWDTTRYENKLNLNLINTLFTIIHN